MNYDLLNQDGSESEKKIDCTGCAGCDYDDCRRMTEMLEQDEVEIFERMNFLAWMKTATREEIDVAMKNNAKKLTELTIKMEDFKHKIILLKSPENKLEP